MASITETELLEALREAQESGTDPEGALTTEDLCDQLDKSVQTVRKMIRAAIEAGTIECVYIRRLTISGRQQKVPAYRPKAA